MAPTDRLKTSRYVGQCLGSFRSPLILLFDGKESRSQIARNWRGKQVEIGQRNQNHGVMAASNSNVVFDEEDVAVFPASYVGVSRQSCFAGRPTPENVGTLHQQEKPARSQTQKPSSISSGSRSRWYSVSQCPHSSRSCKWFLSFSVEARA
jgi:hypothetical protein